MQLRAKLLDVPWVVNSMDYERLNDGQGLIVLAHNYSRISVMDFDTGKLVKTFQQDSRHNFPVREVALCDFEGALKNMSQV